MEPVAQSRPAETGPGGDHDQPYQFGRRPRASATFPFTTRQYALMLALRGRVEQDRNQRMTRAA